jgi:anti-anti-sigma regulatory factor
VRHWSLDQPRAAKPDWTYSETIDDEGCAIEVRGRVDGLGVDLLRGTIEELSQQGHPVITVTIPHPDAVDAFAQQVLAEVTARLAQRQVRLTIRWSAAEPAASYELSSGI